MHGGIKTTSNPYDYTQSLSMMTGTPSRSGFPRGFLWDDGFHNLIISKSNPDLSMKIIANWLDTQAESGWIPREQMRGWEIESYGNPDYIIQIENEANPPTLLFPINFLLANYMEESIFFSFLKEIYPKLKKWFEWLRKSHKAEDKSDLFKWGQSHNLVTSLGSGLDDYPRNDRNCRSKYNLDLHIWLQYFAETLKKIATKLNNEKDINYFDKLFHQSNNNLYNIFLDKESFLFKELQENTNFNLYSKCKVYPSTEGYVNLFPFFFGYINQNSKELDETLDLISDERRLWTSFGIASLSKADSMFEKNDNYWTGPIWIPINFLILKGLSFYKNKNSKAKDIYNRLRDNLINTVCSNFKNRGYFFENYDVHSGQGQRRYPFNGWTSTISLIISEDYDF